MSIDNCNGFVYVVQEDDSLYSISRRFNISLSWLINANVNNDIYNLFLGKRICIPNRDPYIDVIPIIPIRPWPGNIGGPGPVEPFKNTNPYTSGPKFDPRDPRYGTENPFGRIGDADEDDEYTSVVYEDDDDNDDFASTDLEAEEKVTENTSDNQTVETTDREEDMWTSDDYDVDYDRSATGNNDRMMNTDPRYPMYDERTNDPRYPIYDERTNDADDDRNRNMTNGNMTNRNMTNGNMTNGNMTNGNMTNGNMTNGNMTNGTRNGLTPSQESARPYVVISYVVKNDDNLSAILERFDITPADVLRYNDTLRIYLKPGTVLRVPNINAMDDQKYEPN